MFAHDLHSDVNDRSPQGGAAWTVVLDIEEYLKNAHAAAEAAPKGVWPVFFDAEEQCLMEHDFRFSIFVFCIFDFWNLC